MQKVLGWVYYSTAIIIFRLIYEIIPINWQWFVAFISGVLTVGLYEEFINKKKEKIW